MGVDDVVLVSIPLKRVVHHLQQWKKLGTPPGGPTALWSPQESKAVFWGIFKGLLSPEELENSWQKISNHLKQSPGQISNLSIKRVNHLWSSDNK